MKKQTVMGLVQKAIIDSMNFSKRDGSIIFVNVYPNVNSVYFCAYKDGWIPEGECVFNINIYTIGCLAPSVREAKQILKPIYDLINSKQ